MKKLILPGIVFTFLVLATTAGAGVFTVTPTSDNDCSDFNCDLQSALTATASNGQDDTINIAAGTYTSTSTLTYLPSAASAENFALTIIGAGTGTTIVDGGANAQLLNIDTTLLANGSLAAITIKDLTITGSGDVTISSNALVTVPAINAGYITLIGSGIQLTGTISATAISATGTATLYTGTPGASGLGIAGAGGSVTLIGFTGTNVNFTPPTLIIMNPDSNTLINTASTLTINTTDSTLIPISGTLQPFDGITATAGGTVTLDAVKLIKLSDVTFQGWKQVLGPPITLSDPAAMSPTFVAPSPGTAGSAGSVVLLKFECTAVQKDGNKISFPVGVIVYENGISGFPTAAVTFKSATNENMGMNTNNGTLTSLVPIDPATLANTDNMPSNMIYGVLDMQIKVGKPGDTATVTVFLPAPAPAGYTWFKYNSERGWFDFSDYAVFNGDRSQVTLTLVDGGIGDDDGVANGVIRDPSGLASASKTSSGGGGGCFIATAAYGSLLHPHVATLRAFRDTFLLTNPLGEAFVKIYYRYSPPAADFIARHDALRFIARVCLIPAIALSWIALEFGSAALSLTLSLSVLMLCAQFVYKCFKRKLPVCAE